MRLAAAPVSWGVDFAEAPGNPAWTDVLDGIAATGLGALELGPVGYLPEDPARLRAELGARGLRAAGSFVFEPLHDPAALPRILATTRRACAAIAAAGGDVLVIVDRPSAARAATAGCRERATAPPDWAAFRAAVLSVAAIARDAGLEPLLHPHAGTHLEFEDEIDAMLDATGLGACADTGHLAFAGLDPARWIRDHAGVVRHLHFKDIDRGRTHGGFWTAVAAGAFVPLGEGAVDLADVLAALHGIRYDGWAVIEQDRRPGSGDPVADIRRSVDHLRALGAA